MAHPDWVTDQTWDIIQAAKGVALLESADEIALRHLFRGCAVVEKQLVTTALAAGGVSAKDAEALVRCVSPEKLPDSTSSQRSRLSASAQEAVDRARALASDYPTDEGRVAPVHLWASICDGRAELKEWLLKSGWPENAIEKLGEASAQQLPRKSAAPSRAKGAAGPLEEFCHRNLTELASQDRLTLAYGMEEAREQLIACLLKKNKPSVVLTGPAGVGKTKLVEDLALRIYRHEIPELHNCEVSSRSRRRARPRHIPSRDHRGRYRARTEGGGEGFCRAGIEENFLGDEAQLNGRIHRSVGFNSRDGRC